MNLVSYDIIDNVIDKTKTWVDIVNKRIMSKEVAHRNYVCFGKRYDNKIDETTFFIIILDDYPEDRVYSNLIFDGYGRAKINVKPIWNDAKFCNIKYDKNITLEHIEHTDDGDIYKIEL